MENKIQCVVIGVVTNEKDEILLCLRNDPTIEKAHNNWELPGGKLEFGETLEQGVVREMKEETGLDVEVIKLIPYVGSQVWEKTDGSKVHAVFISYHCKAIGGEIHTSKFDPKISEIKFIDYRDFKNYRLLPQVTEIVGALIHNS